MSYGGGETTPGGRALPYFASIRLRISKTDTINEGPNVIGQDLKIDFKKNKVGTPFKVVATKLLFGKGFDFESEFVSIAEGKGVIKKGGAWYSWTSSTGEQIKHQGAIRAAKYLKENAEEFAYLQELCKTANKEVATELLPEEDRDTDESYEEE